MRELRIVGVGAGATTVECETGDGTERFTLPLDDRLRAAARGEYTGPDPAMKRSATLSPREIQSRIRHGAAPEEVAAEAGVALSRIDGFAYPVMLERSTAAEKARAAHPVLSDGPALDTLDERVSSALEDRGIDRSLIRWDAWRAKDGSWEVQVAWPAGLSEDATARWVFVPDSHGGSVRPLDEAADTLVDPSRRAPLRSVEPARHGTGPDFEPPVARSTPPVRAVPVPAEPAPTESADTPAELVPAEPAPGGDDFLQHPQSDPSRRAARRHPTVPSWEDVLLGVRGKDD